MKKERRSTGDKLATDSIHPPGICKMDFFVGLLHSSILFDAEQAPSPLNRYLPTNQSNSNVM